MTEETTAQSRRVGTVLAFAALAMAFVLLRTWGAMTQSVAIPEDRTLFVLGCVAAAGLAIFANLRRPHWIGRIATVPAILIGSFLLFTIYVSPQQASANAIRVGDTLPAFTAVDDTGAPFDSERLRGHPVLIKFFRAHW